MSGDHNQMPIHLNASYEGDDLYTGEQLRAAVAAEREACALEVWPTEIKVWSEEEMQAMTQAFNRAQEKHGWYETMMAVGASVLKIRADAIRAREAMDKTSCG
jgi:hypothetical protein